MMSHIEHMQLLPAVSVRGALKPVFVSDAKMWQLGKMNVVVFRLSRTIVLGFQCSEQLE